MWRPGAEGSWEEATRRCCRVFLLSSMSHTNAEIINIARSPHVRKEHGTCLDIPIRLVLNPKGKTPVVGKTTMNGGGLYVAIKLMPD